MKLKIFCPQQHPDLMIIDNKEKQLISTSKVFTFQKFFYLGTAEDSLSGLKMNKQILDFKATANLFFFD